ncbi:hypothetical protein RHMOL_Rhmol01G0060500 [Rhododendron molle]|uniref:Uncharacterized protein n=1 Tax=Rhododendron molle TaxID=49168 RepID=A0ACC0PYT3_RHOML|nr:hypothetical protein RHMOL_Rhmol01G0060500 [Rhododendron molle]
MQLPFSTFSWVTYLKKWMRNGFNNYLQRKEYQSMSTFKPKRQSNSTKGSDLSDSNEKRRVEGNTAME